MNKFLKKCSILISILLIANTILFFPGKKIYYDTYSIPSLKFDSYLLSDSHGEALSNYLEDYGIYNFSAGSDSYEDMYRKLEYLLDMFNNTLNQSVIVYDTAN
jgi:hypothetical protein